ncbi:WEB family protein At1g75720 [Phalaenopsis equestris]|uniref:WEB family protein At1g75720 n=1 Tax=Phalaenopsis equestris TaxID=78828 RepID=UPI0009E55C6C|nr:WEB family protein At1g75720 [Phalaenopsis equestris]
MTSSRSEVDTRRPFQSVKEAGAGFGERILSGEAYSQSISSTAKLQPPPPKPQHSPPSPSYSTSSSRFNQDGDEELSIILSSMKKLEAEIKATKREVTLLKERESETEIAVASLNAELHKNKAKLAEMEAASGVFMEKESNLKVGSDHWGIEDEEEEIMEVKHQYIPSLAAAVILGEADDAGVNGKRKGKLMKKKPIVPLIGDLFSRKKDSIYSRSYFSAVF